MMRSVPDPAPDKSRLQTRKTFDLAALVVLAAFALIWPSFVSPQFWADGNAQHDILGIDSSAYYNAVLNDMHGFAFERRPLFGLVMLPLKRMYVTWFGLQSGDAVFATFRTVGIIPPLLVYALARLHLRTGPSFALALFSAATLVAMFHNVAYETYSLTMSAGLTALITATALYRWSPDPVTQHPILAAVLAIVVTAVAGWVALTLTSMLLVFAIPAVAAARRAWLASLWAGFVAGAAGILFIVPSLLKPGVTQAQGAIAERYFVPANLLSVDAWANVLISDFIAALAYPGEVLSGSRFPGITNVEDWMGPLREQAMSNPWAILLGVMFLGLMGLSCKAVGKAVMSAYLVLAIWIALGACIVFFVIWGPGEAMLFAACVWPYQMALAAAGRAQIGPRRGLMVDIALIALAVLMFANNLNVLNETASMYD
jgi:hypothetical protein